MAEHQFALLAGKDYEFTSDDVIFTAGANRAGIAAAERGTARAAFFAKGQACLRTSPLTKTYGWGIHADGEGRVALVPMGSPRYAELVADPAITKVAAMKSRR